MPDPPAARQRQHVFQPPRGTRDFYPAEMLRRRWIEDQWRRTAIRHGFDEIDGPRFEHADLYTVKSGEGILSELFSFKRWAPGEGPLHGEIGRAGSSTSRSSPGEGAPSGDDDRAGDGPAHAHQSCAHQKKDASRPATTDAGTWYALRPEFTPTLARMVAARANSLPKPTKWFSVGPYFRAERPQRGRLREFLQWNVDIIGQGFLGVGGIEGESQCDAALLQVCVALFDSLGFTPDDLRIKISHRSLLRDMLLNIGMSKDNIQSAFRLIDKRDKLDPDDFMRSASSISFDVELFDRIASNLQGPVSRLPSSESIKFGDLPDTFEFLEVISIADAIRNAGIADWCDLDLSTVRGIDYYTGMVFEVHEAGDQGRAIAGGGRYDNLVDLFGGPLRPAAGFAMGDVVLMEVLQDKGLMPSDAELRDRLGLRPDVFVISTGKEESEAALASVVAGLRRAGLHARHTYKATRNVGKLLKEAASVGARFAAILDNAETCALKDLDTGAQTEGVPIAALAERVKAARTEADRS